MIKKYYHATPYSNLGAILSRGLQTGMDGLIYLTESRIDALKFIAFRHNGDILTIEVELDDDDVEETFDHSYSFFKAKSFGYPYNIPRKDIDIDRIRVHSK